jgi:hypothetical protein
MCVGWDKSVKKVKGQFVRIATVLTKSVLHLFTVCVCHKIGSCADKYEREVARNSELTKTMIELQTKLYNLCTDFVRPAADDVGINNPAHAVAGLTITCETPSRIICRTTFGDDMNVPYSVHLDSVRHVFDAHTQTASPPMSQDEHHASPTVCMLNNGERNMTSCRRRWPPVRHTLTTYISKASTLVGPLQFSMGFPIFVFSILFSAKRIYLKILSKFRFKKIIILILNKKIFRSVGRRMTCRATKKTQRRQRSTSIHLAWQRGVFARSHIDTMTHIGSSYSTAVREQACLHMLIFDHLVLK